MASSSPATIVFLDDITAHPKAPHSGILKAYEQLIDMGVLIHEVGLSRIVFSGDGGRRGSNIREKACSAQSNSQRLVLGHVKSFISCKGMSQQAVARKAGCEND